MNTPRQELKIRFATKPEYTHKIFDIIENLLDIVVLDKDRRYEFVIGLGEALDNAIVHGNKLDQDKFVEINCAVNQERITCTITDQGKGFGYQRYLTISMAEFDPKVLIRKATRGEMGGLGLGLIRKCMDKVHFNKVGNQITLIKYLRPS